LSQITDPHHTGVAPSLFGRRSWLIVTLRAGGEPGGVTSLWKAELLARIAIATATARGFQGHMAMAEGDDLTLFYAPAALACRAHTHGPESLLTNSQV
jgi:hypothetical protein